LADIRNEKTPAQDGPRVRRRRFEMATDFRPALSVLMEQVQLIHAVVAQDDTRLSRSHALSEAMGLVFAKHKTEIVGLTTNLEWANNREFEGEAIGDLMARFAERKLTEACEGGRRGVRCVL